MLLRHGFFSVGFVLIIAISLYSQTTDAPNSGSPTFQSNVKVVLVDVTVTDRNDQPIAGLKKEDFEVFEEGKPQTIASFEEHKGVPPSQVVMPPLPPHFYTNYPLAQPADSVNVLMLDALNTPLGDQANVHKQMVGYLKDLKPGSRLAIFTLGSHLRLVEGFTADPAILLAALNNKKFGGRPLPSPMLLSEEQANADQQMLDSMISGHASGDAIGAMADFLSKSESFQNDLRIENTLDALQQLARYLSGFSGRKNLIWFSGSFPALDLRHLDNDGRLLALKDEIRRTTNMLAAAQVALYPITAQGLELDTLNSASIPPPHYSGESQGSPIITQNNSLQQDRDTRILNHTAMDDLARDTGGRAFYNTNGLSDAMNDVITNGTHYYTISYASTDKRTDGRYRPIVVKLAKGHYRLAYRRGYFAEDAKEVKKKDQAQPSKDPLQMLMGRGMPDSTQIIYKIRVLPADMQPDAKSAVAGDNKDLNPKNPVIRYAVDFAISPKDIKWQATPDGLRHGNLEVTLVAYDHDGKTLNWLVRSMNMALKPELYAAFERGGVQLHEEIDVPKGDVFLRTGVYDLGTGKAGTMEVSLPDGGTAVTAKK